MPLKRHVFDEMRQPALVVVLEHRAGVDHQPQLGAASRLPVRPHEVLQAVRQPADADLRIDRDDLGQRSQRSRRRPAGRRGCLGGGPAGGDRNDGEGEGGEAGDAQV